MKNVWVCCILFGTMNTYAAEKITIPADVAFVDKKEENYRILVGPTDPTLQKTVNEVAAEIEKRIKKQQKLLEGLKKEKLVLYVQARPTSMYVDGTVGSVVEPDNWPTVDSFKWYTFTEENGKINVRIKTGVQAQLGMQPFGPEYITLRVVSSNQKVFWMTLDKGLQTVEEIVIK